MAAFDHHSKHLVDRLTLKSSAANVNQLLYSALLLALIISTYRFISNDYQKFLNLGPGGTPSTFPGYLRVTYLRIFFALKDPFQPPSLAHAVYPSSSYLQHLTQRSSPRPHTEGIAPHRQTNQWASAQLHRSLRNALCSLVNAHPTLLRKGNSCFEKRGLALFLSACSPTGDPQRKQQAFDHLNPTCRNTGEIIHLHGSDSSMHMTLHPIDAALVIASGWGELHPLAGRSIHGKRLVPHGFIMVYAPQAEHEIDTIIEIVKAGGWWVGGVDLEKDGSGRGSGQVGAIRMMEEIRGGASQKMEAF